MRHSIGNAHIGRRDVLRGAVALAGLSLAPKAWAQGAAPLLKVETRSIEVKGKAASVFRIAGPNGNNGLLAREGDRFSGAILNASGEPLQLHWHGQIKAPFDQDRARPGGGSLANNLTDTVDFELTAGTHWMHSHTLSEQRLLAAPMVTVEKEAADIQNVVIMLHDFAFRSPEEILAELGGTNAHGGNGANGSGGMMSNGQGGMMHNMPGMMSGRAMGGQAMGGHMMGGHMMGMAHANDVRYDAYLANDRSFDDPEVVRVEKGARVRLRIINGGTATAFFVSAPGLAPKCVAVDGNACQPLAANRFPLAQGQRLDIEVLVPKEGGAFPIIAQVEDLADRTGVILATAGATVAKASASAERKESLLDLDFESRLRALQPLAAKRADKAFMLMLGEEAGYRWTINGHAHEDMEPFDVRKGERVELSFMNPTGMMHPMHLHGHHFQVVAIGGRRFAGAMRDTVIVPGHMPVTVALDATNTGNWFLHCHHLYHMATGMMTELRVA